MNKQTFLNLFPLLAYNSSVQKLADPIEALDRIQQNYASQVWWLDFWSFFKFGRGKEKGLAELRKNAQIEIAAQVNLLSKIIIEKKIEHDRLTRKIMDCILEAFTAVVASKSEGKNLVLLTPTWQTWGDFVDSLAEKFQNITVQVSNDGTRSRIISYQPPTDDQSRGSLDLSRSTMILNSQLGISNDNSRRSSLTVRSGLKPGLGGFF